MASLRPLGELSHPNQPIGVSDRGVHRFKQNNIVRFLLDWASDRGMSLNQLVLMPFQDADWVQFYQLIGYSVRGFGELNFSDEWYSKAVSQLQE